MASVSTLIDKLENPLIINGARDKQHLIYLKRYKNNMIITTDDGSFSRKCFTTDILKEQLKNNLKQVKQVVFWGVLICLAVYLLFSTLIIGISGTATSRDGISSLSDHFGELILFIGYVFGIITTFTSFIALGLTVKKLFWYDYHLPKIVAWSLASFIPLGLFVIGLQDFIGVIGITGAVMLGLDGVLVTLVYLSMKRRQKPANYIKLKMLGSSLIVLLSVGVVLQIFYTINGY